MGRWTLQSISGTTSPYNAETIGHNLKVKFTLRYETSAFDSFKELPILTWNEQFFMIEHHKGEWWEFAANMYEHNPSSRTLEIWPKRYLVAYDTAHGQPFLGKGSSRLLTKNGTPVQGKDLGRANSPQEKTDRVRHYLKKHGGILEITVHDIPSINKPDASTHKERLLVFDCGFAGGGPRYKGAQYLDMDGSRPQSSWIIDFQPSATVLSQIFQKNTIGKRKVLAPQSVAAPRAPCFLSGEVM